MQAGRAGRLSERRWPAPRACPDRRRSSILLAKSPVISRGSCLRQSTQLLASHAGNYPPLQQQDDAMVPSSTVQGANCAAQRSSGQVGWDFASPTDADGRLVSWSAAESTPGVAMPRGVHGPRGTYFSGWPAYNFADDRQRARLGSQCLDTADRVREQVTDNVDELRRPRGAQPPTQQARGAWCYEEPRDDSHTVEQQCPFAQVALGSVSGIRSACVQATVPLDTPPNMKKLHPFTEIALCLVGRADNWMQTAASASFADQHSVRHCAKTIHIYTDGSARGGSVGWGFLILLENIVSDYYLLGATGGQVIADGSDERWCGELAPDSYTAEITAIVWALAWCVAEAGSTPVHFHIDNISAKDAAAGKVTAKAATKLTSWAYAMTTIVSAKSPVHWFHVKGHSGHPWNEYADVLALAGASWTDDPRKFPLAGLARQEPHLRQLQIEYAIGAYDNAGMPVIVDGTFSVEPSDPPRLPPAPKEATLPRQLPRQKKNLVPLKVATMNVTTLHPDDVRKFGYAAAPRGLKLRRDLVEAGVVIAGIQEARTAGPQICSTDDFWIVSSGAVRGQLGCEIWVAKEVPSNTKKTHGVPRKALTIVEAAARFLWIAIRTTALTIDAVAIHGPTSSEPNHAIAKFWDDVAMKLRRKDPSIPLVVLADANGRMGSIESPALGTLDPDEEDTAGAGLRTLLEQQQLWAPSTCSATHIGQKATWQSPDGFRHRIDFVAVPQRWKRRVRASWADTDIDVPLARRDHFPVIVELSAEIMEGSDLQPRRPPIFERAALHDSSRVAGFVADVAKLDVPSWNVHASDHYQSIFGGLKELLKAHFPVARKKPRKEWVLERTWALMQTRSAWRHTREFQDRECRTQLLKVAFGAWRLPIPGEDAAPPMARALLQLARVHAVLAAAQQRSLTRSISKCVKEDKATHVATLAAQAEAAARNNDTKALYKYAGKLTRGAGGPPPTVILEDGLFAANPREAADRWQRFFAKKFAATPADFSDLWKENYERQADGHERLKRVGPDVTLLPSAADVLRMTRAGKRGRAHGEDGIPAEVWHAISPVITPHLQPLMWKIVLRFQEPVWWKGGAVVALHKSGAREACENHRGITIGDVMGKQFHTWLRRPLMPRLEEIASPGQCGGISSRGTDVCSHTVRAFFEWGKASRRSVGAMFADVVGAFDSVILQLLMQGNNEVPIFEVLRRCGMEPDQWQELLIQLEEASILAEAGLSHHHEALLEEAHAGAWASIEFCDQILRTSRGTKPGDPLGDVLFNFVAAAVMKYASAELADRGLSILLPETAIAAFGPSGPCVMADATYADDTVFFATDKAAGKCAQKLSAVAEVIYSAFRRFGLELNPKPGKTELLVALRGKGSKAAKEAWFGNGAPGQDAGAVRLRVVTRYRHMGGWTEASCGVGHEVRARAAIANATTKSLRPRVFRPPEISLATKTSLAGTLVHSRLLFNVAVWAHMNTDQNRLLRHAYVKAGRAAAALDNVDQVHTKDEHVLKVVGWRPLEQVVTLACARYFARLARVGPPHLLRLIDIAIEKGTAWTARMRMALLQLQAQDASMKDLPGLNSPSDWAAWVQHVRADLCRWASCVRRAFKVCGPSVTDANSVADLGDWPGPTSCEEAYLLTDFEDWPGPTFCEGLEPESEHLVGHDEDVPPVPPAPMAIDPSEFVCSLCSKRSITANRHGTHLYRCHGVKNALRRHIRGTDCINCHVDFRERDRLFAHLKKKPMCAAAHIEYADPLTLEESNAADAAALAALRSRTRDRQPPRPTAPIL